MNTEWKPIASAPKDGTEILAWRHDCGQFIASYTSADSFPMTQDELDAWDEETLFAKDWFTQWPQALRLEGSEVPTLWQPMPTDPCATCNGHGMIGGPSFYAPDEGGEPCPDCSPPAPTSHPIPTGATGEEKDDSIALDKLADYIADNWPDKKYGLEEICQRLHATWPGAFMPAAPAAGDALELLKTLEKVRALISPVKTDKDTVLGAKALRDIKSAEAKLAAAIAQQKGEA